MDSWTIACSESSTVATLTMQISGSTPQGNQFDLSSDPSAGRSRSRRTTTCPRTPRVDPHRGIVTIGGSARTAITELTVTSNNVLARAFYNARFLAYLRWMGRKTTVHSRLQYVGSPDDRTNYEALASESLSIGFNNGTHGFVMDCKSTNVYDPFEDDLKLADTYYQSQTSGNMWDVTAGTDFSLAFT